MTLPLLFGLPQVVVKTPRDLDALAVHTYIFAAIAAVVFLAVAAVIANAIAFDGGAKPRDPGKRRMWYWLLLVASVATFFLYNMFGVAPTVASNLQGRFLTVNAIGTGITAACYLVLGFVLSKMFSTGKLGNWFSSRR